MSNLFAFPGQGAQKPGMLQRLPQEPEVLECLAQAGAVLGEDARLLDSAEALQSTRAVQLCLLIAGVAGARLLMRDGQRPDYVAGLSIGAYAAAVVAGALDYDAVRLVALRGELMRAYPHGYGMTAILGLSLGTVEGPADGGRGPPTWPISTPTTSSSSPAATPWPRSPPAPRLSAPPVRGAWR